MEPGVLGRPVKPGEDSREEEKLLRRLQHRSRLIWDIWSQVL